MELFPFTIWTWYYQVLFIKKMLNVSSPSPLYDDQASSNVSMETTSKKNTSMYGVSQPSGRPTLNNDGENLSNENLSSEENMKKIT